MRNDLFVKYMGTAAVAAVPFLRSAFLDLCDREIDGLPHEKHDGEQEPGGDRNNTDHGKTCPKHKAGEGFSEGRSHELHPASFAPLTML